MAPRIMHKLILCGDGEGFTILLDGEAAGRVTETFTRIHTSTYIESRRRWTAKRTPTDNGAGEFSTPEDAACELVRRNFGYADKFIRVTFA